MNTNTTMAFVFPGQGSQTVGMLQDIAEEFSTVAMTFQEASEELGYDLWEICQKGPAEELNKTTITQPAMLAGGVALWRVWNELGHEQPVLMAGHSLGEYTALVCAQAIQYKDAVKLVAKRAELMQEAVPAGKGAMGAIVGLENDIINKICAEQAQGQVLSPANYNTIGQVVVAGETAAVLRAMEAATKAGAMLVKQLPMSVPSHCLLMKSAAEKLALYLHDTEVKTPKIKVLHNVDVESHESSTAIKKALVEQLYNPVRWVEILQKIGEAGVTSLYECGPGRILSGLVMRVNRNITAKPLMVLASLRG